MTTIVVRVVILYAYAVGTRLQQRIYSLDSRLIDFGEEMLMVAYDSTAYGSLLHIVAYEGPVFHVPNIIKHEKMKK